MQPCATLPPLMLPRRSTPIVASPDTALPTAAAPHTRRSRVCQVRRHRLLLLGCRQELRCCLGRWERSGVFGRVGRLRRAQVRRPLACALPGQCSPCECLPSAQSCQQWRGRRCTRSGLPCTIALCPPQRRPATGVEAQGKRAALPSLQGRRRRSPAFCACLDAGREIWYSPPPYPSTHALPMYAICPPCMHYHGPMPGTPTR